MKNLIIIPAYNEGNNIINVIESLKDLKTKYNYIIINDGSKDNTEDICKKQGYNYISLPKNLGIGGAVQKGYQYAEQNDYDIAIQFDGDGQHDSKYLDSLAMEIENGADMVIGSRYIEKQGFQSTFMRRVGKNIISLGIKILCDKKITDPTSGFRACNKKVIKLFAKEYPNDYPEPQVIVTLLKNKYNVKEIPVIMKERQGGNSSITPIQSTKYMIKVLTAMALAGKEKKGK